MICLLFRPVDRRALFGLATVAALFSGTSAEALTMKDMENIAAGTEAYQTTKAACLYHPVVAEAFQRLDRHMKDSYALEWGEMLRRVKDGTSMMTGLGMFVGKASRCGSAGRLVARGLPYATSIVDSPDDLQAELTRLEDGGGVASGRD